MITYCTITHPLPLGQSVRCDWCPRAIVYKYESLVTAAGEVVVEHLCNACAGMALVTYINKSKMQNGKERAR